MKLNLFITITLKSISIYDFKIEKLRRSLFVYVPQSQDSNIENVPKNTQEPQNMYQTGNIHEEYQINILPNNSYRIYIVLEDSESINLILKLKNFQELKIDENPKVKCTNYSIPFKLCQQPIQDISIVFQKPIQVSPPSTPEEIYRIQPQSSRSTLNNKKTNVPSNSSNSQRILQQNISFHLPKFPKSISPQKLCEQYKSPLRLKGYTYNNIQSPISLRVPNRRATKVCSKVLQKYKKKYYL